MSVALIEDLKSLEDWEDRYRYLIEIGQRLEPFPESGRIADNKIQGCVSQVWMITEVLTEGVGKCRLIFHADSDAFIVRGLIALILSLYSGKEPQEILKIDALNIFQQLGLAEHLSQQRSNGIRALVDTIQIQARAACQKQTES